MAFLAIPRRPRFFFFIVCCVLLAGSSHAQSFLFVSPNTREHMTEESAWDSLQSLEQRNFLAVAGYFAGKICDKPQIQSAEGIDGVNTENSSLITGCSGSKAQYLGELLGRYAHQKWIMVFNSDPKSKDHLLIVTMSTEHPEDIARELRRSGIAGTIVAQDKTARLYLWVTDSSKQALVRAFVAAHKGALEEMAGTATLLGNGDRAVAQGIFDQRIRAYERAHHLALSHMLWSRRLRDLGL